MPFIYTVEFNGFCRVSGPDDADKVREVILKALRDNFDFGDGQIACGVSLPKEVRWPR